MWTIEYDKISHYETKKPSYFTNLVGIPGEPMPAKRDGEIIRLLGAFSNGAPEAEARLTDLTYRELRKIAAGHLRRERSARSLQTTDLVHEAYLRLVDQPGTPWRDRAHFFQVAAHVMRQILIDRARKRHAGKRGGGVLQISLDRVLDIFPDPLPHPSSHLQQLPRHYQVQ
jgi:RNA polymerase sigma factor (TIGR02999 family)